MTTCLEQTALGLEIRPAAACGRVQSQNLQRRKSSYVDLFRAKTAGAEKWQGQLPVWSCCRRRFWPEGLEVMMHNQGKKNSFAAWRQCVLLPLFVCTCYTLPASSVVVVVVVVSVGVGWVGQRGKGFWYGLNPNCWCSWSQNYRVCVYFSCWKGCFLPTQIELSFAKYYFKNIASERKRATEREIWEANLLKIVLICFLYSK